LDLPETSQILPNVFQVFSTVLKYWSESLDQGNVGEVRLSNNHCDLLSTDKNALHLHFYSTRKP